MHDLPFLIFKNLDIILGALGLLAIVIFLLVVQRRRKQNAQNLAAQLGLTFQSGPEITQEDINGGTTFWLLSGHYTGVPIRISYRKNNLMQSVTISTDILALFESKKSPEFLEREDVKGLVHSLFEKTTLGSKTYLTKEGITFSRIGYLTEESQMRMIVNSLTRAVKDLESL